MNSLVYIALAVALPPAFLLPGWLWLRRCGVEPLVALYAGFGATVAGAGAIVGLAVVLPWSVPTTCAGGAVLMLAASAWCARTAPRPLLPDRPDLAGVAVFCVAFASMAAFTALPSRPTGNYGAVTVGPGLADSARWPGAPSDNTLPYRTGQVALHKLGGAQIRDRYAVGWWLSDRTPLTGLTFAFAAGVARVHVPVEDPTLRPPPMQVTDEAGFWAYNLVAIFLNVALVLGTFLLARTLRDRRTAIVACLAVALMPGVFLNAVYTWPKQAVAYFLLVAAAFALRRRPVLTGAFGALGYLCHPGGVFWLPALAILLGAACRDVAGALRGPLLRFAAAAAVVAAPWTLFTSQVMHATSRWTTAPLGYLMKDPTHLGRELGRAWRAFSDQDLLAAGWTRLQSAFDSLAPIDLSYGVTPGAPLGAVRQLDLHWVDAHGYAFWGMVGLVLFPAAVVALVRRWPADRALVLRFVLPGAVVVAVASGFTPPFLSQNMFVVLGVLAIFAADALRIASTAWRNALLLAIGIELGTVAYAGLYAPFNIDAAPRALFTAVAVIAQLGLLGALAVATGAAPRLEQRLTRIRPRASRFRVARA